MADEIGIHDDGVLTAVRGTIFMAKAETIITSALLKQFTVEAATVGVGDDMWTHLGHMSNDNLPEFALDGGDATTLSAAIVRPCRLRSGTASACTPSSCSSTARQ